jgi:hypothetical protein
VIKGKKGQPLAISLVDTKEVSGTVVSIHSDFFVMSVGENKEEHIIPFVSVAQIRPVSERGWSLP